MKATILSGLIAVALGGLTSCSNILEENGVINNVAESGMGELRINLTTDASLNVSTKGGEEGEETSTQNATTTKVIEILSMVDTKDFTIQGQGSTTSNQLNGKVSDYATGKVVPADTYTITAENTYNSEAKVAFNNPHFKGEISDVKVDANTETAPENFVATLQNSVITVDATSITELLSDTKNHISALYVEDPSDESRTYSLLNSEKTAPKEITSVEDLLFVDSSVDKVKIVMIGSVDEIGEFTASHEITTKNFSAKNFLVSYKISQDNGTLKLTVTVNGNVTEKSEKVTINPYPTTPVTPAAE